MPPETGQYGPSAAGHEDVPLWAPLAVAIDAEGKRVAAADYQGWERRFAARLSPGGKLRSSLPARAAHRSRVR